MGRLKPKIKTCLGKKPFNDLRECIYFGETHYRDGRYYPYFCLWCGYYHITTTYHKSLERKKIRKLKDEIRNELRIDKERKELEKHNRETLKDFIFKSESLRG